MTVELIDGTWLEDHKPMRFQFRVGRRAPVKPVIVIHTTESGVAPVINVAKFIQKRPDPGSYHLVGDPFKIVQLVAFENEAYADATGSNRWAVHISLAMNADEWGSMTEAAKTAMIDTAATMATKAAVWLRERTGEWVMPRRLDRGRSDRRDANGFLGHADRDPDRRTDPGREFPWAEFFDAYQKQVNIAAGDTEMGEVERWQNDLLREGADLGRGGADGIFGPMTLAAGRKVLGSREAYRVDLDQALIEIETVGKQLAALDKQLDTAVSPPDWWPEFVELSYRIGEYRSRLNDLYGT